MPKTLEIFRMPYQQKALHCYLMLSIWILLLIAGVYKFLEPKPKLIEPPVPGDLFENLVFDVKTKKIFQICNLPQEIVNGDEGNKLLLIRAERVIRVYFTATRIYLRKRRNEIF